ncbi:Polynucleotide 5'-hydroxyl-kinase grc3 [Microbotryomycetes sp. JL201]|nr:Polynucleotide 5'-hydroxyl-kinase grc3 [Microbotryomycetes sp. JL201]
MAPRQSTAKRRRTSSAAAHEHHSAPAYTAYNDGPASATRVRQSPNPSDGHVLTEFSAAPTPPTTRLSAVQARKAALAAKHASATSLQAPPSIGASASNTVVRASTPEDAQTAEDSEPDDNTSHMSPKTTQDSIADELQPKSAVQRRSKTSATSARQAPTRYFVQLDHSTDQQQKESEKPLAMSPNEAASSDEADIVSSSQRPRRRAKTATVDPLCVSLFSPSVDENTFILKETGRHGVVYCLKQNETLVIHGTYTLTLLAGSVTRGQALLPDKTTHGHTPSHMISPSWPIIAPASHPLLPIEPLPGHHLPSDFDLGGGRRADLSRFCAAVLITDFATGIEAVEPLLSRGDVSAAQRMWPKPNAQKTLTEGRTWCLLLEPQPGCILARKLDSWSIALRFLQEATQTIEGPIIVMIEGPKRVGKSAFARQLVNTILQSHKEVAFLDTDLGQPEFTPPGCISLSIIDRPMLGPSFTNVSQPRAIRFCGSTSPANDPAMYSAAVSSLVQTYRDGLQVSEDSANMPLVVNTHGWNKGLGADLVRKLGLDLKPSHVVSFQPRPSSEHEADASPSQDHLLLTDPIVVDPVPVLPVESRWTAADLRALNLVSHLSRLSQRWPAHSEIGLTSCPLWDFDTPLIARTPLLLPFAGSTNAVSRIYTVGATCDEQHILRALNGSLVAIALDKDGENSAKRSRPMIDASALAAAQLDVIGLGVVRAVDAVSTTLHVVCPALAGLDFVPNQVALLKSSALDLPLPLWLDGNEEDDGRDGRSEDDEFGRSDSPSRLSLQVLDVTSTAVALSVYSTAALASAPNHAGAGIDEDDDDEIQDGSRQGASKPSTMSIQVNGRPWPHVAHAGADSSDSLAATALDGDITTSTKGTETTIIIYGLDPGKDYELTLDVIAAIDDSGESELQQATVDIETAAASRRPSEDLTVAAADTGDYATTSANGAPDGPPPPYSATVPSALTDEPQLRALLKRIRASSKRTESVLNASISALKKNVEKGLKEDQRARTRIVGLEEAIRRTSDGTRDMRTIEMEACEERIRELCDLEEEVREELERRRDNKGPSAHIVRAALERRREPSPVRPTDELGDDEESHEGIGELARELDSLNRSIGEAEQETSRKAKDTLRTLEHELAHIEDEIGYIDREELSHYASAMSRKSFDSLSDRPFVAQSPHQQPPASGFNLRWRRAPAANQLANSDGTSAASSSADPRSFGRFFRRTTASEGAPPPNIPQRSSYPSGETVTDIQSFAQAHQARSMPSASASSAKAESSPKPSRVSLLRRRSGSASGAGPTDLAPLADGSSPSALPVISSSVDAVNDKARPSSSGGSSWGRWSQVVGKGKNADANADKR